MTLKHLLAGHINNLRDIKERKDIQEKEVAGVNMDPLNSSENKVSKFTSILLLMLVFSLFHIMTNISMSAQPQSDRWGHVKQEIMDIVHGQLFVESIFQNWAVFHNWPDDKNKGKHDATHRHWHKSRSKNIFQPPSVTAITLRPLTHPNTDTPSSNTGQAFSELTLKIKELNDYENSTFFIFISGIKDRIFVPTQCSIEEFTRNLSNTEYKNNQKMDLSQHLHKKIRVIDIEVRAKIPTILKIPWPPPINTI